MPDLKITEEHVGKRADITAAKALPSLSRAFVHRLFEEAKIRLNQEEVTKAGTKLRRGDVLHIDFDLKELDVIEDIDLPIIYEDKNVLVVDKLAGVISHARGRFWNEPSVASFVRQKTGQPGERAGIVHRLDRATSGVMVCAKNQAALSWLQKQFSERKTSKQYTAIVKGEIEPAEAIIDMPIERNPNKPQTFMVSPTGRMAQTSYKTTPVKTGFSLVELQPLTGRTHQIRVHLAKLNRPIVGDELYGGVPAKRLMLHATSLGITLPDKSHHTFKSPLPAEFKEYLNE